MDRQEASGLNSVRVSFQRNGQTRQNLTYVLALDERSGFICVLIFSLVSTHCANRAGQRRVQSPRQGVGVHRLHSVLRHCYPNP